MHRYFDLQCKRIVNSNVLLSNHTFSFLYVVARWSGDRNGLQSRTGQSINTILSVLEDLDSFVFEKTDVSNGLDGLYNRLFASIPSKEGLASSGGIHSGESYANDIDYMSMPSTRADRQRKVLLPATKQVMKESKRRHAKKLVKK